MNEKYLLFRQTKVGQETHWNMFSHAADNTFESVNQEFDLIKKNEVPAPKLRIVKVTEEVIREE